MEEIKGYIGCKRIKAEPQEKEGKSGYKVVYPDGYVSWSPKEIFEKAYRSIDDLSYKDAVEMLEKGL